MFAKLMGLKTISPQGLQQLIHERSVHTFDVNSRQHWAKARVPGAVNLDPYHYQENALPANKDATLVFYCSNTFCRKAPNAARRAKGMGYTNALVMSSGIAGWIAAELATETGE